MTRSAFETLSQLPLVSVVSMVSVGFAFHLICDAPHTWTPRVFHKRPRGLFARTMSCRYATDYDAFRYELRRKERDQRKKAVERRRHDQVKDLRLSARISENDLKTKADQAMKFLREGHKVTMRIEFKVGGRGLTR